MAVGKKVMELLFRVKSKEAKKDIKSNDEEMNKLITRLEQILSEIEARLDKLEQGS